MRLFLLISTLLIGPLCPGQSVSLGAIGGVRATDDLSGAGATSASRHYVVGPAFELGLPLGFGVEVNALYRREGYQTSFGSFAYSIFSDERSNSWEFPILLKYKPPISLVKPFIELGYAPRILHGTVTSDYVQLFPTTGPLTHSSTSTNWPASHGIAAGGGVQIGLGRLHLSPTLRYTHWNNTAITGFYGDGPSWQSTQDQFDIMLGITWKFH